MMPGWIKLHRKIMENDLWKDKPFARGQAWIDLLMLANYENKETWINGKCIQVETGTFITSIRTLSDRWGWSNTKTVRFLNELETLQMVNRNSDTEKTTITIVNYAEYQAFSRDLKNQKKTAKKTQKRHENDTETTQKHTTKEIKNITSTVTLTPPVDTGASVTPEEDDDSDWDTGWTDPNADLGGNDGNI